MRDTAVGEPREVSEREWAAEMRGWAGTRLGRGSPAGRPDVGASGIDVGGQGLVELEVGNGVGLGEVESRCLIEKPGTVASVRALA